MLKLLTTDCLEWMRKQPDNSVNLTFGSGPYEDARTYDIEFNLKGDEFVQWMADVICEAVRITDGLVAFVIEGKTKKFAYSASPILIMAELHKREITLRKPPIYHRVGIPGSGGPDWWRNDYEFIICATSGGKLPWSDNTVMGHPPKWAPGGEMSYRHQDGMRKNQRDKPQTRAARKKEFILTKAATCGKSNGDVITEKNYKPPKKANPGNVIRCTVGGNQMGHKLCHENEAPFPEKLAEFFVRSFCPPGGIVLDPFSGSGTTAQVALQHGRSAIGIDIRKSQIQLAMQRISESVPQYRKAR